MKWLQKIIIWLSSLKVAIVLILVIAIASAIGTSLPQNEIASFYLTTYKSKKFLGLINGDLLLNMELDHVYSSIWFLSLLIWLSLSLIICSWRRQWPTLKKAMLWIDYQNPKQIERLAISQTVKTEVTANLIPNIEKHLMKNGWQVKTNLSRVAARKGLIGRVGPPLVHFGLIFLIFGASYGVIQGQKIERFLAPERSLNLSSPNKGNQISLKLSKFKIERGPNGQPEQFKSSLELQNNNKEETFYREISVNHPLRFRGLTFYQADWSLAAITIQINNSPKIQFPLKRLEELGEQAWGVLIPSINNEISPILLTLNSEDGPVNIFSNEGNPLGIARPGGDYIDFGEGEIRVLDILPSSGIIIKYDPGVPVVYLGFGITLLGSLLSIIPTNQIWIIKDDNSDLVYIGGLSNRNLSGLISQFPQIINVLSK